MTVDEDGSRLTRPQDRLLRVFEQLAQERMVEGDDVVQLQDQIKALKEITGTLASEDTERILEDLKNCIATSRPRDVGELADGA